MIKKLFITSLFILTAGMSQAEDAKFIEGEHYTVLPKALQTSYRGDEIGEIMEFFSYACIHCFNLEPGVVRFLNEKPDNIRFTPVPVMFNERQTPEVRAYYVLRSLQLGDEAHQAIFNAIHRDRKSLRTDAAFASFFDSEFGIDKDRYMKEAYSFGVNAKVKTSVILTGTSGIGGTPSIIVNGKYQINSGAVGGNELALYAAQWLVENDPSAE